MRIGTDGIGGIDVERINRNILSTDSGIAAERTADIRGIAKEVVVCDDITRQAVSADAGGVVGDEIIFYGKTRHRRAHAVVTDIDAGERVAIDGITSNERARYQLICATVEIYAVVGTVENQIVLDL